MKDKWREEKDAEDNFKQKKKKGKRKKILTKLKMLKP